MDTFKREERYIIIKRKDLIAASSVVNVGDNGQSEAEYVLRNHLESWAVPTRAGLVIEADWPEFEPAWAMIERRMTGLVEGEFTPGEVEPVGDCGKWAAEIDHKTKTGAVVAKWYERIRVLGDTKEDAEALRSRILAALNADSAPAPVEWDGQGLPPVGVRIEAKHKNAQADWARPDFYETEIVAIGKQLVIFEADGSGHEKVGTLSDYIFRPIRTPEQIAAEERLAAINYMEIDAGMCATAFDGDPEARVWVTNLIDKGWRKPMPATPEERDKAIAEMVEVSRNSTGFGQNIADHAALYDAGYRKQVTQ